MVRVGACSWTAPGWDRVFYPPRTAQRDYITRYAERYDTVEIDATFYAVPDPKVVLAWKQRTPDGFIFSAKVPRAITHDKVLVDCDIELGAFMESMSKLEEKLGVLVFQFPYFAKDTLELPEFLDRLSNLRPKLPQGKYAVEIRNRDWIASPLFARLRDIGFAFAPTAFPGMPSVEGFANVGAITADFTYIRLLGDRIHCEEMLARELGEVTFTDTVVDRTNEIARWAKWIESLTKREVSVYVYINNHYSGFAPRDIDDLKGRLDIELSAMRSPPQAAFDF